METHWPTDVLRLRDRYFSSEDQLLTLRLYSMHADADLWAFAKQEDLWLSTEMGDHIPQVNGVLHRLHERGAPDGTARLQPLFRPVGRILETDS